MHISDELNTIVAYAREEAMRTGSYDITPDHLFLAVLRHSSNSACEIIDALGADRTALKNLVEGGIMLSSSIPYPQENKVSLDDESNRVLADTIAQASRLAAPSVKSEHLLLALSRTDNTYCRAVLESCGIDFDSISGSIPRKVKAEPKPVPMRILGAISIKAPDIYS